MKKLISLSWVADDVYGDTISIYNNDIVQGNINLHVDKQYRVFLFYYGVIFAHSCIENITFNSKDEAMLWATEQCNSVFSSESCVIRNKNDTIVSYNGYIVLKNGNVKFLNCEDNIFYTFTQCKFNNNYKTVRYDNGW